MPSGARRSGDKCTYAPAEEWGALAGVLAGRLAAAGDAHAATLCNVCAGDVDAAVGHWLGALPPGPPPSALHSCPGRWC